tara:strand:- start:192 stop:779 length:588 start_codon:yes stop_codon:yes gene_type:complete
MVASNEIISIVIFLLIIRMAYTKIQKSKTESMIGDLVSRIQQLTPMKKRSDGNDDLRFSSHSQMIQNNKKIAALVPDYIESIRENQSTMVKGLVKQNNVIEILNDLITAIDGRSIHETDIHELSNKLVSFDEKYVTNLDQISANLKENSVTIEELISQQDLSKQKIGEFISYLNSRMDVINDYIRVINRKIKEDY